MTIRDVMTRSVITVQPETPLKEVARLLVDQGISGLPVVAADGRVLGVVSEADFLLKEQGEVAVHHRALERILGETSETKAQRAKLAAATAGEAMTSPAVTIEADRTLPDAAAVMVGRRINRLPVTEDGRLVGIVTRADLVRAYVRSDLQLTQTIRDDVLLRAVWVDPDAFDVEVHDGVVRIAGHVERRSTAELIERVTAMVPGVIAVDPALAWSLDDRDIKAPQPDYISPFGASRTR